MNNRLTYIAFREKLANWLKISSNDAIGLRQFSDFLNACQDAMPYVKGLHILNDCQENQKLIKKLPDWAISRWNRQVAQSLCQREESPSFEQFAEFVSTEAEIACNPATSLHTLHFSEGITEKRILKGKTGGKVSLEYTSK